MPSASIINPNRVRHQTCAPCPAHQTGTAPADDTGHERYPRRQRCPLVEWRFQARRCPKAWMTATEPAGDRVRLPHCWNAQDDFQQHVPYRRGWGSYRTDVCLPDAPASAGASWFLVTEGFFGTGDLWINGVQVEKVDGQYLGLEIEVTPYLGPHEPSMLALRLNNRHHRHVLPGIRYPDFLLYGGLSGRAWLECRPVGYLDSARIRVNSTVDDAGHGQIDILREIPVPAGDGLLTWCVSAPSGETVARVTRPAAGVGARLRVEHPLRWSDTAPHLYRLQGELQNAAGQVTDTVVYRIGFRTAVFEPRRGFFLNGIHTELRGCNRHECMPGFGRALPLPLHREDAQLLKQMGLNFVRLSHYPQHPAFLDACDELGILVYPEIATWKSVRGWGRWLQAACRQMDAMVRRDRHRPSVTLWGMGNESRVKRAYRRLRATVRALDADRPVTYAENHFYRARRRHTTDCVDVWGLNYEFEAMEDGCQAARLKNVIMTECTNRPDTRRGHRDLEFAQAQAVDMDLRRLSAMPGMAGFALWCFNDYGTLRKDRYARHCGMVDAWRLPKMAADYLSAAYRQDPFIRLHADWGVPSRAVPPVPEDRREVCVFTNGTQVSFLINGETVAVVEGANPRVLTLPFRAGTLRARAEHGNDTVEDACCSWRDAVRLTLMPEGDNIPRAQDEWLPLAITVVDADGHPVRDWSGQVRLSTEGPASSCAYTGNDDVHMAGGRGRGFLRPQGAGRVQVRAETPGLEAAVLDISINER